MDFTVLFAACRLIATSVVLGFLIGLFNVQVYYDAWDFLKSLSVVLGIMIPVSIGAQRLQLSFACGANLNRHLQSGDQWPPPFTQGKSGDRRQLLRPNVDKEGC